MSSSRNPLPFGHSWLIERMQKIKYRANKKGVCCGVAHMAMQAILLNDVETFNRRLELINAVSEKNFASYMVLIRGKQLALLENIKSNYSYTKLSKTEKALFESSSIVQSKLKKLTQTIEDLIKEGKIPATERDDELDKRKAVLLNDSYLQSQWNKEMDRLDRDEMIELEIPAFFEGIELYQHAYLYPALYKQRISTQLQGTYWAPELLFPNQLGEQVSRGNFSGAYTIENLTRYFDLLKTALATSTHSVALLLMAAKHAITVAYDTSKQMWLFTDANQLPMQYIPLDETKRMAMKVASAFKADRVVTFATTICTHKSNEPSFINLLNQREWKKLHNPATKSLSKTNKLPWLASAIIHNQLETIKELLSSGIDLNIELPSGATPLVLAVENGNSLVVEMLLEMKADSNLERSDNGDTPLIIAVNKGHLEVVKILLQNKADPDLANYDNHTPLIIATEDNYLRVVETLLKGGANPNLAQFDDGTTPLFAAARMGHLEVAKALLDMKAKPNIKKLDGATPLFIAVQQNKVDLIKELLVRGANPNVTLSDKDVTPLFIAAQLGYLKAVEILLQYPKTRTSLAFKTTANSLRDFAIANNVSTKMEIFLNKHKESENIHILPAEIAELMGNSEIAILLKSHQKSKILTSAQTLFSPEDSQRKRKHNDEDAHSRHSKRK